MIRTMIWPTATILFLHGCVPLEPRRPVSVKKLALTFKLIFGAQFHRFFHSFFQICNGIETALPCSNL